MVMSEFIDVEVVIVGIRRSLIRGTAQITAIWLARTRGRRARSRPSCRGNHPRESIQARGRYRIIWVIRLASLSGGFVRARFCRWWLSYSLAAAGVAAACSRKPLCGLTRRSALAVGAVAGNIWWARFAELLLMIISWSTITGTCFYRDNAENQADDLRQNGQCWLRPDHSATARRARGLCSASR